VVPDIEGYLPAVVKLLIDKGVITPDGSAYYDNRITFFEIAGHSPGTKK
jgi:hypothetical protein